MATDINENINTGEEENPDLSQPQNEKDTDWKRRTLELEDQLCLLRERVNSQTGKIREAVSQRVCILCIFDELSMSQMYSITNVTNV
jgi:hypothetical protein